MSTSDKSSLLLAVSASHVRYEYGIYVCCGMRKSIHPMNSSVKKEKKKKTEKKYSAFRSFTYFISCFCPLILADLCFFLRLFGHNWKQCQTCLMLKQIWFEAVITHCRKKNINNIAKQSSRIWCIKQTMVFAHLQMCGYCCWSAVWFSISVNIDWFDYHTAIRLCLNITSARNLHISYCRVFFYFDLVFILHSICLWFIVTFVMTSFCQYIKYWLWNSHENRHFSWRLYSSVSLKLVNIRLTRIRL